MVIVLNDGDYYFILREGDTMDLGIGGLLEEGDVDAGGDGGGGGDVREGDVREGDRLGGEGTEG